MAATSRGEVGLPALLGQHRLVEQPPSAQVSSALTRPRKLQVEVEHLAVAAHERARQQPPHGPGSPNNSRNAHRGPSTRAARKIEASTPRTYAPAPGATGVAL